MVYLRLIQLIEDHATELTSRLRSDLLGRVETKGYCGFSEDLLRRRIHDVYRRLGTWLNPDRHTLGEITTVYTELGKERFREGIPLNEVVLAFMLAKRNLWVFVQEMRFLDSMDEVHQALELNNKVVLFFDRAIYFVTKGYVEELLKDTARGSPRP